MSLKGNRVGVLMGGLSSERGISLKSGHAVCEALKDAGWDAVGLEVNKESEEEIRALVDQNHVRAVFIAMHGGFGEDGRLQHILEKIAIPFTGSKEKSSRLAMDKLASRRLFEKAGLRVPKYISMERKGSLTDVDHLQFPLVVKPSCQGSSIGITFVDSPVKVSEALAHAFEYDATVLIEEFIAGREITVAVLDGRALPVVEIVPKKRFFDFQAKYEKGLTDYVVPAELSPDIVRSVQSDAVTACRILECRHLCRVDMILANGTTPYILEVNTIPGFTSTSLFPKAAKAAGISFQELCTTLLALAERNHG